MEIITSICGDLILRGTAAELEKRYAKLGYDAERSGDHVQAQIYFQHSENYKRTKDAGRK